METLEEKKGPRKKISLKKTLRLYKYVKPYLFEFIIGMIFLLISSLASLAFPKLLGDLVDSGSKGQLMQDINRIGLLLVLILGGQALFSFLRVILFVNVTEKTLASLRQNIYSHMIRLPMKFFVSRRVGELSSRISSDISLLQETFTMTIAEFIRQVIIIIGGIVLLISTSVQLTLLMLTIIPVILLVAMVFGKVIRKYAKDIQTQVADSNTIVEETLQGVLNVKAFVNEFYEMKRYKHKTSEAARLGIKGGKYRAAFSSFLIMAIFGAMVAVIWRGAMLITAGEMATGQLFSFIIYSGFIGGSASGLAEVYASIQRSIGATENLLEILDEPMEPLTEQIELQPEDVLEGRISFRHVSFNYPSREDTKVLDDVSFNVSADQQVALVGPSGAGKSTIVSMLLRLYEPVHGSIYFDGRDGKSYPLSALRSQMAVVLQDVFLFGGTIRENIAYGKPGASEEEIIAAARQANALDFINTFPDGFNTIVGERGIQLSGGQRQRIAIARAVLKNPRILILDEATSALDAESERLVQDALDKLMEGRTSIVIAHRLATVRKADKIIVLDRGQIVEEGTHKELITVDGGIYKTLSEMQFTT